MPQRSTTALPFKKTHRFIYVLIGCFFLTLLNSNGYCAPIINFQRLLLTDDKNENDVGARG